MAPPAPIPFPVQAKLEIGDSNDKFEQEADEMADQVMRKKDAALPEPPPNIEEPPPPIQRKANSGTGLSLTAAFQNQLSQQSAAGQALPPTTKSSMEKGFGADFGKVRVHTDSKAQSMAEDIQAKAFTHGNDIYFNRGNFQPESKSGQHLIAHELSHTLQQTGKIQRKKKEKQWPSEADHQKWISSFPDDQAKRKWLDGHLKGQIDGFVSYNKAIKAYYLVKSMSLDAQNDFVEESEERWDTITGSLPSEFMQSRGFGLVGKMDKEQITKIMAFLQEDATWKNPTQVILYASILAQCGHWAKVKTEWTSRKANIAPELTDALTAMDQEEIRMQNAAGERKNILLPRLLDGLIDSKANAKAYNEDQKLGAQTGSKRQKRKSLRKLNRNIVSHFVLGTGKKKSAQLTNFPLTELQESMGGHVSVIDFETPASEDSQDGRLTYAYDPDMEKVTLSSTALPFESINYIAPETSFRTGNGTFQGLNATLDYQTDDASYKGNGRLTLTMDKVEINNLRIIFPDETYGIGSLNINNLRLTVDQFIGPKESLDEGMEIIGRITDLISNPSFLLIDVILLIYEKFGSDDGQSAETIGSLNEILAKEYYENLKVDLSFSNLSMQEFYSTSMGRMEQLDLGSTTIGISHLGDAETDKKALAAQIEEIESIPKTEYRELTVEERLALEELKYLFNKPSTSDLRKERDLLMAGGKKKDEDRIESLNQQLAQKTLGKQRYALEIKTKSLDFGKPEFLNELVIEKVKNAIDFFEIESIGDMAVGDISLKTEFDAEGISHTAIAADQFTISFLVLKNLNYASDETVVSGTQGFLNGISVDLVLNLAERPTKKRGLIDNVEIKRLDIETGRLLNPEIILPEKGIFLDGTLDQEITFDNLHAENLRSRPVKDADTGEFSMSFEAADPTKTGIVGAENINASPDITVTGEKGAQILWGANLQSFHADKIEMGLLKSGATSIDLKNINTEGSADITDVTQKEMGFDVVDLTTRIELREDSIVIHPLSIPSLYLSQLDIIAGDKEISIPDGTFTFLNGLTAKAELFYNHGPDKEERPFSAIHLDQLDIAELSSTGLKLTMGDKTFNLNDEAGIILHNLNVQNLHLSSYIKSTPQSTTGQNNATPPAPEVAWKRENVYTQNGNTNTFQSTEMNLGDMSLTGKAKLSLGNFLTANLKSASSGAIHFEYLEKGGISYSAAELAGVTDLNLQGKKVDLDALGFDKGVVSGEYHTGETNGRKWTEHRDVTLDFPKFTFDQLGIKTDNLTLNIPKQDKKPGVMKGIKGTFTLKTLDPTKAEKQKIKADRKKAKAELEAGAGTLSDKQRRDLQAIIDRKAGSTMEVTLTKMDIEEISAYGLEYSGSSESDVTEAEGKDPTFTKGKKSIKVDKDKQAILRDVKFENFFVRMPGLPTDATTYKGKMSIGTGEKDAKDGVQLGTSNFLNQLFNYQIKNTKDQLSGTKNMEGRGRMNVGQITFSGDSEEKFTWTLKDPEAFLEGVQPGTVVNHGDQNNSFGLDWDNLAALNLWSSGGDNTPIFQGGEITVVRNDPKKFPIITIKDPVLNPIGMNGSLPAWGGSVRNVLFSGKTLGTITISEKEVNYHRTDENKDSRGAQTPDIRNSLVIEGLGDLVLESATFETDNLAEFMRKMRGEPVAEEPAPVAQTEIEYTPTNNFDFLDAANGNVMITLLGEEFNMPVENGWIDINAGLEPIASLLNDNTDGRAEDILEDLVMQVDSDEAVGVEENTLGITTSAFFQRSFVHRLIINPVENQDFQTDDEGNLLARLSSIVDFQANSRIQAPPVDPDSTPADFARQTRLQLIGLAVRDENPLDPTIDLNVAIDLAQLNTDESRGFLNILGVSDETVNVNANIFLGIQNGGGAATITIPALTLPGFVMQLTEDVKDPVSGTTSAQQNGLFTTGEISSESALVTLGLGPNNSANVTLRNITTKGFNLYIEKEKKE